MKNIESTDEILQRIFPHILLNSSFVPDLGLFHGKMGIVLFFAHYARYTGNSIYDDFAGKLLDEIYEDITMDLPINLEYGLCGIGWGIEYLIQNGFVEGDSDLILSDFDKKVMELDPRRVTDLSFRKGLGGILFYILSRVNYKNINKTPFDDLYIKDCVCAFKKENIINEDVEIPKNSLNSFENLLFSAEKNILKLEIPEFLYENTPTHIENVNRFPYGIENGLSGIGLKSMFI